MPSLFAANDFANAIAQLVVARAAPHEADEIVVALGEEARPYLPVGRDAHAAAVSAERMRNRRNDSNLANSVVEGEPPRRFGGMIRGKCNQRVYTVEPLDDFIHADHGLRRPGAVLFERHPLDKADDHALSARELREG